jgi:hypothetical protein
VILRRRPAARQRPRPDALVHHGVDLVIAEYKKKRNAI